MFRLIRSEIYCWDPSVWTRSRRWGNGKMSSPAGLEAATSWSLGRHPILFQGPTNIAKRATLDRLPERIGCFLKLTNKMSWINMAHQTALVQRICSENGPIIFIHTLIPRYFMIPTNPQIRIKGCSYFRAYRWTLEDPSSNVGSNLISLLLLWWSRFGLCPALQSYLSPRMLQSDESATRLWTRVRRGQGYHIISQLILACNLISH